ncbi:hypothetical protein [Sphingorhabdus sp. SMR4y]|uniref:hypothetical protein n=1 Tax=Sphingorhabdus sp. SMR4y TaxID=2584094 RepID=UPI000B5C1E6A|nr:hypothetical protein [Sphingorhabdus sp. SMR4y]
METPTLLYQQMIRNIDHARKLVSNVEPNGCKTDLQHLKLRSFVLLTHSIIEEYIEDLGREVAVEARKEFKKGKITKALVALISGTYIFM